jgi:hypothetical protein
MKAVMRSRAQLAPTEELWDREHSSLLQKSYGIASTARSYRRVLQKSYGIASTARSYRRVMGSRAQLAPTEELWDREHSMCEGFARIKDAET